MKFFGLMALLIALQTPAWAQPTQFPQHTLVIFNEASNTKLTVYTPEEESMSELVFSSPQQNGSEIIIARSEIATKNIAWSLSGSPREIREPFVALEANLGRSGQISVRTQDDGFCNVVSSVREFFLPKETKLVCSYFYVIGPKPGFSGSN